MRLSLKHSVKSYPATCLPLIPSDFWSHFSSKALYCSEYLNMCKLDFNIANMVVEKISKYLEGSSLSADSLRICQNLDFKGSVVESSGMLFSSKDKSFPTATKIFWFYKTKSNLLITSNSTLDKTSFELYYSKEIDLNKNSISFAFIFSFIWLEYLLANVTYWVPNTTVFSQAFLYFSDCSVSKGLGNFES